MFIFVSPLPSVSNKASGFFVSGFFDSDSFAGFAAASGFSALSFAFADVASSFVEGFEAAPFSAFSGAAALGFSSACASFASGVFVSFSLGFVPSPYLKGSISNHSLIFQPNEQTL